MYSVVDVNLWRILYLLFFYTHCYKKTKSFVQKFNFLGTLQKNETENSFQCMTASYILCDLKRFSRDDFSWDDSSRDDSSRDERFFSRRFFSRRFFSRRFFSRRFLSNRFFSRRICPTTLDFYQLHWNISHYVGGSPIPKKNF